MAPRRRLYRNSQVETHPWDCHPWEVEDDEVGWKDECSGSDFEDPEDASLGRELVRFQFLTSDLMQCGFSVDLACCFSVAPLHFWKTSKSLLKFARASIHHVCDRVARDV